MVFGGVVLGGFGLSLGLGLDEVAVSAIGRVLD